MAAPMGIIGPGWGNGNDSPGGVGLRQAGMLPSPSAAPAGDGQGHGVPWPYALAPSPAAQIAAENGIARLFHLDVAPGQVDPEHFSMVPIPFAHRFSPLARFWPVDRIYSPSAVGNDIHKEMHHRRCGWHPGWGLSVNIVRVYTHLYP